MGFAQAGLAAYGAHCVVLAAAAKTIEYVLAQQLADAIAADQLHVVALGPQAGRAAGWFAVDFQQQPVEAGADAVVGAGAF